MMGALPIDGAHSSAVVAECAQDPGYVRPVESAEEPGAIASGIVCIAVHAVSVLGTAGIADEIVAVRAQARPQVGVVGLHPAVDDRQSQLRIADGRCPRPQAAEERRDSNWSRKKRSLGTRLAA